MIRNLEQKKVYKYLAIDQSSSIQDATVKQKIKS